MSPFAQLGWRRSKSIEQLGPSQKQKKDDGTDDAADDIWQPDNLGRQSGKLIGVIRSSSVREAANTLVAVSFGGLVPLMLRGMRTDPALASGPLLTTVTDMCGFFFVLSFASLMLPRITG